ncbi:MAG: ROK family protein [Crenarchaeota archaeon]|nr:ROK family protein [Thermoproteota archaeon]
MSYCICVDIGATRLRVGLGIRSGEILDIVEKSTREIVLEWKDELSIARGIEDLIRRLLSKNNVDLDKIVGIGIGSIGPLDVRRGVIVHPPNLPLADIDYVVKDYLEDKFGKKVVMLNDCVTAVWGEKWYGAGKECSNIVYVTFSTGIGGGVIVNDTLLLGADGNAHEVGHVTVDPRPDALRCGCGGIGHWEAYCSGIGIPRFCKLLADNELKSLYERSLIKGVDFQNYDLFTRKFFEYLKQNDEFCKQVFEKISFFNAVGMSTVIHYYNPEIIIIGGSIAINNSDEILQFRKYLNLFLMRGIRVPEFRISPLGDYAILKGAIALVFNTPPTYVKFVRE